MTRVDFYLIERTPATSADLAACRLAAKAFNLGHRIYIRTRDAEQAGQLDRLLWTFSAGSFIPHALDSEEVDPRTRVIIGHAAPPPELDDVLINLGDDVPEAFSRFSRVAEIVGPAESAKTHARERFRFYRDRGYPLETHHV